MRPLHVVVSDSGQALEQTEEKELVQVTRQTTRPRKTFLGENGRKCHSRGKAKDAVGVGVRELGN